MSLFREKYRILKPASDTANGETAVMIHGLFVGGFVLRRTAAFFLEHGCSVILYDYPTVRRNIREHSRRLADFLNSPLPNPTGRIHFVTHSMGGLLLRRALPELSAERKKQLGRIVMIAPPNRGSDIAAWAVRRIPGSGNLIAPLHDLSSAPDSFANVWPVPEGMPETGIIGAKHDHQVRPEYTHLPGESGYLMLNGTHTGILFHRKTAEQAYHFLKFGSFKEVVHV